MNLDIISKLLHTLHQGLDLSAKSFGFHDWDSMSNYLFLIINKSVTLVILLTSVVIGINGWIDAYIFSPSYKYFVFIALTVAEVLFGTVKAMYIDKEKFDWDKAGRIIPKLIAHTFALSAAFHMSSVEELLSWMPSTVFIFFSTQNFIKASMHLIELKSLDSTFANFMRDKFSQKNDFIPTKHEDKPKQTDAD